MNFMHLINHLVHNQNKLEHLLAALGDLVKFQEVVGTKSVENDNK